MASLQNEEFIRMNFPELATHERIHEEQMQKMNEFLDRMDPETGVTDSGEAERLCMMVRDNRLILAQLKSQRMPVTRPLDALAKRFTLLEADLDESRGSSTAARLKDCYLRYLQQRWESTHDTRIETETVPKVTSVAGYKALFDYWWTNCGKYLTEKELLKAFAPMISFAKRQARAGQRVENRYVSYVQIPVV